MIHIKLPGLPPTANHAYFNLPGGGRSLSTDGRRYKNETTAHIAQNYPLAIANVRSNTPYALYIRLFLEALENQGWPKKAKTRYKNTDVSNRVKLLEDCLKDACGIDDSQNLIVIVEKRQGAPFSEVFLWNMQEEVPPLGELRAL